MSIGINFEIFTLAKEKSFRMPFNKLDTTAIGKIRPRFKLASSSSQELLMDKIMADAKNDSTLISSTHDRFIKLRCPVTEQHYWSPVLNISFEENEQDEKTYLRGVIGPNEKVWTMFMFFYIGVAVIGTFGGIFSLVKWQTSDNTSYLFIIPLTLFLFGSIFSTSKYGKRKAHKQTLHLMRFLRNALDDTDCIRVEV